MPIAIELFLAGVACGIEIISLIKNKNNREMKHETDC